jgi:hypothetical protein
LFDRCLQISKRILKLDRYDYAGRNDARDEFPCRHRLNLRELAKLIPVPGAVAT